MLSQNCAGWVPFTIDFADETTIKDIKMIEFNLGKYVHKYYRKNDISEAFYDTINNRFLVPLLQIESQSLTDLCPIQIRVQYDNGAIDVSHIQYINIQECISQEVM